MPAWQIKFEKNAVKDLKKLPPTIHKRIGVKLKWFIDQADPISFATLLVGNGLIGEYRYRVGSYRILFDANKQTKTIIVRVVMHRREVYKNR